MSDSGGNDKHLPGYTLRKNGTYMRDRRIRVIIPEESIKKIMEVQGIGAREAEFEFLNHTLRNPEVENCGLYIEDDRKAEGETLGALLSEMPNDSYVGEGVEIVELATPLIDIPKR